MSLSNLTPGDQHSSTLHGSVTKVHGLNTYVVEPSKDRRAKGIIVIISDAFGLESVSNRLLADAYATKGGYKVYLPDFMLGHACPSWFLDTMRSLVAPGNYFMKPYHVMWGIYAFVPWMYHNRHSSTLPTVKAFFEALRRDEGSSLPVGVAGFSWGGKHALLLTHRDNYLDLEGTSNTMVDAAFIGHPISVDIPRDFDKITVPTSFAIPQEDHHIRAPRDTDVLLGILESKPVAERGEVRVYERCAHGFCARADFSSAGSVEQQAVDAEDQAVAWFNSKLDVGN